jgi:sialidase-1
MNDSEGLIAVSWGQDRIDLFWVGTDRALMHRSWNAREGGVWSADESLGGTLDSDPTVTAWDVDQMEVFAIFPDGQLWNRYWDGISWHEWESLGGELTGQPACSSWGAERLDVFAPGRDGRLWHRWWNGVQWVPWQTEPPGDSP